MIEIGTTGVMGTLLNNFSIKDSNNNKTTGSTGTGSLGSTKSKMNKNNPKILTECIILITSAVRIFGTQINLRDILKILVGLFNHTNINIRREAVILSGELYIWVGLDVKGILLKKDQGLRASQVLYFL